MHNWKETRRLELLKLYGSFSLAYTTLQPGIRYFDFEDGYIAYQRFGKSVSVLGDPVARDPELGLGLFIDAFPEACFYVIGEASARFLAEQGFYLNAIGEEHLLSLESYKGTWSTHRSVRAQANIARRLGVLVLEGAPETASETQLRAVSEHWVRQKRRGKEQGFLTRPLLYHSEPGYRYFFAYVDGALVGYRFFAPIYESGKIVSYYSDIVRLLPEAPRGTSYLLADVALRTLKSEGVNSVSLGLSPFSNLGEYWDSRGSLATHNLMRLSFCLPFFKGLYLNKSVFHGERRALYFASRSWFPIGSFIWSYWGS